ncbi:hypothetical protein [Flagellimonas flava]|uniref:hypothetical protein n=1 Tax=Flagellimonas flava TaxID=570519 RepID=UPI003D651AED
MEEKIDRNNPDDLLMQIGRTESDIAQLNRDANKLHQEIESWPKRLQHLEMRKELIRRKISRKQKYIGQLTVDLAEIKARTNKR